ncbi:MAG: hypothetical protein AAF960_05970 [Bacteroidota bacterium]
MEKSRLIEVLRTFSKKEVRDFKKWLLSPIHNQREDVVLLFEYLTNENCLNDDNLIKKEIAFPCIFPNERYDDAKMRQVMHFMFKNVEEFLAYNSFNEDYVRKKISLAKVYRSKKLEKNFLKVTKEVEKNFQQSQVQDEEILFKKFALEKEIYEFQSSIKRTQGLNLQKLTDLFDESYISEKLRHGCLINSHKKVFKTEYAEGLLSEVTRYVSVNKLLDKPRIGAYFYLYRITSKDGTEEDFYTLRGYMDKVQDFPKSELREIYLFAINFCIAQMNSGNEAFLEETFTLYKNGIERQIFLDNNILSRWTFKNAIVLALRMKEFEWVENFIENFHQYLEEKYRESFLYFNYAKLYYARGDYERALEVIQKYEFSDILINLDTKTMLLKIYYETDEFKVLESLLESMRAYIQRKKVIGYQKALYKNMVRYTKKLLKVNPYSKAQKEKLRAEIKAAKPLTEKAWLLKQLAELR